MKYKRGDVVLVLFPNSDLRTAKRRPVLIIQRDDLASGLNQHLVAMISSNLARVNHPSRVLIRLDTEEGRQTGLLTDSVIMTDNIATIHDNELDIILGHVNDYSMVEKALKHTFGL